jgi:hypothetical protein
LWEEAESALRASLDLALQAGNRIQQALTELDLAIVLQHTGREAEGRQLQAQAREQLDVPIEMPTAGAAPG